MNSRPNLHLAFPRTVSVAQWSADHRAGLRPGTWPYGLDLLRESFDVSFSDADAHGLYGPTPGGYDVTRGRTLQRKWQGVVPDLLISWEELTGVSFPFIRRHGRMKVASGVIWALGGSAPRPGVVGAVEARATSKILRQFDALWSLADHQSDLIRAQLGKRAKPRVSALRFGIDVSFFRPSGAERDIDVFSGGGDRDRDLPTLYATLARVIRHVPSARVVVQTKSGSKAPSGVKLFDALTHTQMRDLYSRSRVVVVTLRDNNHVSGMTVALEALACGAHVVITDTPGMREYVTDGVHGTLIRPGSHVAASDAILAILTNGQKALAPRHELRNHVLEHHDHRAMVRTLAEQLMQLTSPRLP